MSDFQHSGDNCAVCLMPPQDAFLLECGHVFCQPCITKVRRRAFEGFIQDKCPLCRAPLEDSADKALKETVVLFMCNERFMITHPDSPHTQILKKIKASLERAYALHPDHVGAMLTLGTYLSDEAPTSALLFLQKALEHGAVNNGDEYPAAAIFRKALAAAQKETDNLMVASIRMQMAVYLEEQLEDIPQAIEQYKAAMKADPTNVAIPFSMGVCLKETDNEGCIAAYRKALQLEPDFLPANLAMAEAYRARIAANVFFDSGEKRGEDIQYWLGALLRAKRDRLLNPEDEDYVNSSLERICQLFPKSWAMYRAVGEAPYLRKI